MPAATITTFYEAFKAHDAEKMAECYSDDAPGVVFNDPVYKNLSVTRTRNMWRALLQNAKEGGEPIVEYSNVTESSAKWVATYHFKNRKVVNVIKASFEFDSSGKIVKHTDEFDLYKWVRMALGGFVGYALGWTPLVQNKVRGTANKLLNKYESA